MRVIRTKASPRFLNGRQHNDARGKLKQSLMPYTRNDGLGSKGGGGRSEGGHQIQKKFTVYTATKNLVEWEKKD